MTGCYIDTSALAKWYLNEPGSDNFETFVRNLDLAVVSRLTAVELRCLLARRRRAGDFDKRFERRAFTTFLGDLGSGHLRLQTHDDLHLIDAIDLVERFDAIPLRALDAMHLALAVNAPTDRLATADQVMASAARKLGLDVSYFGAPA